MAVDSPALNLVVIRSANSERTVQFYRALGLSFNQEQHGDGPVHYASTLGAIAFEVYPCAPGVGSAVEPRLGFRVPSIDQAVHAVTINGGRVLGPPKDSPWGRRAIVTDPDGRKVEITEHL
jgi:lactoylglutathione lyase